MTTLHDRLAALAEAAPRGGPAPDLWSRGHRVHRVRRAGTVVIVAVMVVALGVLGTTTWLRGRAEPAPASPGQGMRLPDQFYAPSPRLAGTDDDGPIGPVAALIYAPRTSGWDSFVNGLAGVSASTGEYRFLDLPGWPETDDVNGSSTVARKRIADHPEPYVRKVLARESISRWRARRWREVHTDRLPETPVDGPTADRVAFQRALAGLAPRQRAVIVLRYYEDLTERETASMLGISVGTVKSQARDALARLRELAPDLRIDDVESAATVAP